MKAIEIEHLNESAVRLIGYDWMLITAGTMKDYNTMTAAWGGLGFLWKKPVAFIFIRPQRYTYAFAERNNHFSLCFFEEKYRMLLQYCGSHSGRDTNKVKETGLTPVVFDHKAVYFEQARLVLICNKLYYQDINPEAFLAPEIHDLYPMKDYHRMYIGEIETALTS